MKYLIVPTQNLSAGIKEKKEIGFSDLPWVVAAFVAFFKNKVFCAVDEVSFIKANNPVAENKKSSRSRMVRLLTRFTEDRAIATGTLMSKSPMNVYDPFEFIQENFWGMNEFKFAEKHIIRMTSVFGGADRGRLGTERTVVRQTISEEVWNKIKNHMKHVVFMGHTSGWYYTSEFNELYKETGVSVENVSYITRTTEPYNPFIEMDELYAKIDPITIRVRREDVFDISLDELVYKPIDRAVPLSAKQIKLYDALVKNGFTEEFYLGKAAALELLIRLQDVCNGFEPLRADGEEEVTLRPLADNPKLDALLGLIEEIDNPVVVWVSRTAALEAIAARLDKAGIPNVVYSGAQNKEEKDEAERKMKSGEARVFIANPASASFGLNSLKDVNYCVWYSINDSVEQYHQAQHRILRGESKFPKFAYNLYMEGTVEKKHRDALKLGLELITGKTDKNKFVREA